jgi:hypothetical protein
VLVLYAVGPYLKAKCQTLSAFLLVYCLVLFICTRAEFQLIAQTLRGPHKMDSRAVHSRPLSETVK